MENVKNNDNLENKPNLKKELNYLKEISGISKSLFKGKKFIAIENLDLLDIFSNKFKPEHPYFTDNRKENILVNIIDLFNMKINKLDSKNIKNDDVYGVNINFSFGACINKKEQIIPIYIIPAIMKISIDTTGVNENDTLDEWKRKVINNSPSLTFVIVDSPFIPLELFNYNEDDDKETYFSLLTHDEAYRLQNKNKCSFDNNKNTICPLIIKDDKKIKLVEYIVCDTIKNLNKETLDRFFHTMLNSILQMQEEKKDILTNLSGRINTNFCMIEVANKEVDILFKAYEEIIDNKEIIYDTTKIYSKFFQRKPINTLVEQNSIFFDCSNHYGSFNVNILPNNSMISLALNQRIVLNTTCGKYFDDGDVLAVNGPPGTGKTTVLQSIVANMVAENTINFLLSNDKDESAKFSWGKDWLKTPKLLNIGCSFTKQAVNNILNSLSFDAPKFNGEEVNLIWNKRWIHDENRSEYPYVFNSEKDMSVVVKYCTKNIDHLENEFEKRIALLKGDKFINNESYLRENILNLKKIIDKVDLGLFKNLFYMNSKNEYVLKDSFYLHENEIKDKYNQRIKNCFKEEDINSISNSIILFDSKVNYLKEIIEKVTNQNNIIINTSVLDINNDDYLINILNQYLEIHSSDEINKNDLEMSNINLNKIQKEIENKNKLSDEIIFDMKNIEKSIVHKIKMVCWGVNKTIKEQKEKLVLLEQEKNIMEQQNDMFLKEYNEFIVKKEELNKSYDQIVADINQTILLKINEVNLVVDNLSKIKKEYEIEYNELKSAQGIKSKIKSKIMLILEDRAFNEFKYAQEAIGKLKNEILQPNMDFLSVFNNLNLLLDNTLRYKCFHLSMRLKEFYFLSVTRKIANIKEGEKSAAFDIKSEQFKNTKLYELNYLSLIFPLIISTLHSLNKKVMIFDMNKKAKISKPNLIDNIIVDESGQVSIELGYIAAWNAKRMLCVGDTDQIKPVFALEKKLDFYISKHQNRIDSNLDIDTYATADDNLGGVNASSNSLMSIAQKLTKYHQYNELSRGLYLVEHRRCPDEIINYCNEVIYRGVLIPKKGEFNNILKTESTNIQNIIRKPWEFKIIEGEVKDKTNQAEANAILSYIEDLIKSSNGKYNWNNIGKDLAVLTPFRNQANYILKFIERKSDVIFNSGNNRLMTGKEESENDLIIGTVHALQGAEKKIILFSIVSDELTTNSMIIKDKSILNVAFSRSKLNVVLFANKKIYDSSLPEISLIRKYCE